MTDAPVAAPIPAPATPPVAPKPSLLTKLRSLTLVANAKRDFHRLWVVRVALMYGAFNGVALALSAFVGVLNPWLLLGIGMFVSIAIVVLRLLKQADPMEPIG